MDRQQKEATMTKRKFGPEAGRENWDRERSLITAGKKPGHSTEHGAFAKHFRKRYSDLRTREGKRLKEVMDALVADLGGQPTIMQQLGLGNIRTELIVLFQISKWIDKQESLIAPDGDLIPVLRGSYLQYSNSLRADLESLAKLAGKKQAPSLDEYLDAKYGDAK